MKQEIKILMDLQAIDLEISKRDEKMAVGFADLESRKETIEKRTESIQSFNERLETAEAKRRELEAQVEDETVRIKDRQTKLMNVQTNREYQSLLKEIEDGKNANKQREEETVLHMEEAESITKKLEELNNLTGAEEKLLAEETEKIDKANATLSKQKEKIVKKRDTKAKKVGAAFLRKYELLREKRNGLAVAGVTNGVCLGCNMNIPPQLFNNLLREEELLSCPTCNRMMYHLPAEDAK